MLGTLCIDTITLRRLQLVVATPPASPERVTPYRGVWMKQSGRTNREQAPPRKPRRVAVAEVVALFPGLETDVPPGGPPDIDPALLQLADLSSDSVTVTAADGRVVYANPATARLIGTEGAERLVGTVPWEGRGPGGLGGAAERRNRAVIGGASVLQDLDLLRRSDATVVPCRVDAVPCIIGGERGILTVAKLLPSATPDDGLDRVAAAGTVTTLPPGRRSTDATAPADRDPVTGLPTRAELVATVERAQADGREWTLLLVDIDRFSAVNESLGHLSADIVLREVAGRISQAVTDRGIVARLRSDDFAVVVDGPHDCELGVEILRAVAVPIHVGADDVTVTVSIGVRVPPRTGPPLSPDRLILQAEHAVVLAKRRGGRHRLAVFDDTMGEGARRQFDTESIVRRAVERGDVVVRHQSIVSLADGRIYGTEALARLGDGRGGFLPPATFIGVAEDTGLIIPLGAEVLRQACRQQAEWLSVPGGPRRVSVNVAAMQLGSPGFVAEVAAILAGCGLAPEHLCLELTESSLLDADRDAEDAVHELVELGVTLALDDFGTGWSSLGYLRRLPVGELKIDRSFVAGLAVERNDAEVVRAIVDLGHALGLTIVAEGVEELEQAAGLRAMGCDLAQGYLYSRPVAPAHLEWSIA